MKLLLIEDEQPLLKSIQDYLQQEGYDCEVATGFFDALKLLESRQYDCLVVDINLPDGNGLNLIKQVKKDRMDCGIIILSARNTLEDRLKGLELGSDDYLTKPFHLSELNARIKAITRRKGFDGVHLLTLNEITVDLELRKVQVDEKIVDLTKKEFDLLVYLMRNRNRVVTKDSLAEHLWGEYMEDSGSFDFLYSHIKNLRKKLLDAGCEDYITTVYGIGYNFRVS